MIKKDLLKDKDLVKYIQDILKTVFTDLQNQYKELDFIVNDDIEIIDDKPKITVDYILHCNNNDNNKVKTVINFKDMLYNKLGEAFKEDRYFLHVILRYDHFNEIFTLPKHKLLNELQTSFQELIFDLKETEEIKYYLLYKSKHFNEENMSDELYDKLTSTEMVSEIYDICSTHLDKKQLEKLVIVYDYLDEIDD